MRGIHDRNNARQLFKVPHTWTHWEEERRTWWAVSILERYINLEPKGLPLATPEPAQGDLLPTADSSWLRGEIGVNQALFTTGFSPVSEIGSFARVCQAAHILGRVINHRNIRKDTLSKDLILDEALQLSATLTALDKHLAHHMDKSLDDDAVTVVDVALCTVARLTLYGTYACNSPDALSERLVEETALQSASIDGIKQIIGTRAATLAQYVLRQGKQHLDASSPLVLQCLYDAATECQWFIREGDVVEGAERTMELLMEAIRLLSQRWSVGGKYLDLLKKREHL
ncbi:hypothetical protein K491DRAFT_693296 [Lophiostoma macrostomum CBS 122681]|uniref:Transcription factor domain-containing protein n=1 Tax=Lophiostoma macrostomum CBS 122681 TaxID=1314788 RepID=A0A6A6T8V5_9PLEO|nr:hypothetical protein K491DRAFT_693296 [Lophiostoma macrostomum CBS 122681]